MITPIFDPRTVHRGPHLVSWLALSGAAGAVNAIAFAACARFVTHVTGTLTRVGMDAAQPILLAEYLLVLGAFVLGAALSVSLVEGPRWRGAVPRPWVPLAAVAVVLSGTSLVGSLGAFGPFGGSVEEPPDFALLAAIALAMGLQNASVASATGMLVRTTHMTGPATDLGIALGTLAHDVPAPVRDWARRSAMLRAGKIAAFAVGAGLGLALASTLAYGALLAPACVVALVAASTFASVPAPSRESAAP